MTAVRAAPAAVALRDLSVVLGGRPILRSVSAEIEAGEFVAVLGPNGAGKSTLLRVLLGLQPVTHGEALIGGRPAGRGRAAIGYAPQGRALDRDLPVCGRDLVALGLDGACWGMPLRGQRRKWQRVDDAIRAVGADAYADAPVGRLSGGEQQRLLLAQATLNNPRLLLLDEPLANLDLHNQREMVALVARLQRAGGTTVLMVTHDVNPLLPVLDRVLYIANGRAALGTVDEVIQPDVLSHLYGSPVAVFRSQGRVFVASLDGEQA